MSERRSDRLRSIIAATVSDAAEDAAPVTVTGSSMATTNKREPSVKAPEVSESRHASPDAEPAKSQLPQTIDAAQPSTEMVAAVMPPPQRASAPEIGAPQAAAADTPARRSDVRIALRAPQRPIKLPKWEKANVTLEPRDLAILERSDAQARAYGFRIRKGGNPSLFVRAGLRLLEELGDRDPEAWIKRIAATTPLGSDTLE